MTNIDTQRLPIGVFDSGVGGLSVLKVLQEQFPNENFIYIGDNANNPVGNRPTEEITEIACRIAETLHQVPVKLMVIACNTFTVVALDEVRSRVNVPVIGVSQGVKTAIREAIVIPSVSWRRWRPLIVIFINMWLWTSTMRFLYGNNHAQN